MTDFVEMFRHWHAGRSPVQIYEELGIDRKTIRKYVAPAIAEALEPAPEEPFEELLWRMWLDPAKGRRVAVWVFRDDLVMLPRAVHPASDRPRAGQQTQRQTASGAAMPYIRDSFWAGRQFESIPQMEREGLRWSTEVYGLHKHRGRDGATPSSVFDAVERDALMPLPRRPFEPAIYTVGAVAPDCHVRSGNAFYSVPWRLLGQRVTVRAAGDVVQMFQAHFFVLLRWGGRGDALNGGAP